jgi:hypothetical protein
MDTFSTLRLAINNGVGDSVFEFAVCRGETTGTALALLGLARDCVRFGGDDTASDLISEAITALEQE